MIPPDIEKKIIRLREYMEKISSYVTLPIADILISEERQAAMERWFLLMVDEAVDINAALAYYLGGRIAESYKSTFHELVPLKLLTPDFAEKIADSAKIRNQLTHDYEKLQKRKAVEEMRRFYELYKEYAKILIEKFITAEERN